MIAMKRKSTSSFSEQARHACQSPPPQLMLTFYEKFFAFSFEIHEIPSLTFHDSCLEPVYPSLIKYWKTFRWKWVNVFMTTPETGKKGWNLTSLFTGQKRGNDKSQASLSNNQISIFKHCERLWKPSGNRDKKERKARNKLKDFFFVENISL